MINKIIVMLLVVTSFGVSCSNETINEPSYEDLINNAILNDARSDDNKNQDKERKPAEIIKFAEVRPGMTVLDIVSDGGFYAEILANIVGGNGEVIAHTFLKNQSNPDFSYAESVNNSAYMSNVNMMYADFDSFNLKENTIDRVFMMQNYHNLYFDLPGDGGNIVQPLLAMIKKGLKPGGMIVIIDNDAEKGSPATSAKTLNRISDEIVMSDMKMAGFKFVDNIHLLKNDWEDDLTKSIFDPSVMGNTSRFVHKYATPDN